MTNTYKLEDLKKSKPFIKWLLKTHRATLSKGKLVYEDNLDDVTDFENQLLKFMEFMALSQLMLENIDDLQIGDYEISPIQSNLKAIINKLELKITDDYNRMFLIDEPHSVAICSKMNMLVKLISQFELPQKEILIMMSEAYRKSPKQVQGIIEKVLAK